ncbi:restriction endonuclease subunit S [Streptococcus uberis]|uniref:restriction endonuclease subunit S n=1 Tax=Streptococcus uberis TaxID=1349 RepID=UPI003EF2E023
MNKIETLLKELCPNGVEWCELWEETVWDKKFNSVENYKQAEVDKYRYLLASDATKIIQEVGEIKILTTNKSDIFTTNEFVEEFYDEEIIAIPWGGNPIVQYYKGKFVTADNRIARVKDKNRLNTKFLYYYLTNNLTLISTFYRGSGIKHPNMLKVLSLKIPIPPLEIQEEIVKILDKFTDYVTELTTELTLRQKQYNYYRDKLFTFEGEEVEWKTLGEIATIQRGASPRPISKFLTDNEDGVPWIKIGDTNVNSKFVENTNQKITKEGAKKSRLLKKGDFILSNSMSFGRPYILKIDGAIHDGWASISDFEDFVISDYLYHYLVLNKTQQYWASKINSGSVSNLNSEIIKSLNVPIPSFEVQLKIVKFLDYFNELTSNLSEGLPKEIGLRQKQYEYYRDKLLSFD